LDLQMNLDLPMQIHCCSAIPMQIHCSMVIPKEIRSAIQTAKHSDLQTNSGLRSVIPNSMVKQMRSVI